MSNHALVLFYRPPYEDYRDLLCICSSEAAAANSRIDYLMNEYPHAYTERSRFEVELHLYFNEENTQ